jgi:ketosteroid isomerase-like protein
VLRRRDDERNPGDVTKEDTMDSTQSELEAVLDGRSEAVWTKDIDRLMSFYSPEIVYFDLVPGLRYTGSTALRARFSEWFDAFDGPIGQEVRDPDISASGELAVAHMLIRASGTLQSGQEVGYWVRATSSFRRSNDGWLIAHEHVSVPVDFESRRPAMDLLP